MLIWDHVHLTWTIWTREFDAYVFEESGKQIYHKYTKKLRNIYKHIFQNISKYIQDIQIYTKIYKIPNSRRPGPARPGQARGRARYIFVHLGYIWIFLVSLVYFFGIFFGNILYLSPSLPRHVVAISGAVWPAAAC